MNRLVSAARPALLLFAALFCLTNCETVSRHFVQPTPAWQSRFGQLQYRGAKTTLIGDVLVRHSSAGDFELTFSKGPGVILLTIRQNAQFVRVSGPLARGSWSGRPNEAPARLRGWVALRDVLLREPKQTLIHETAAGESFTFAF